jgi:hypothetical protein
MTLVSKKENSTYARKEIPQSFRPFFWDVDFDCLDIQANAFFIISRILEHGDEPTARLLFRIYSEREIIQVVKTSRSLSRRSRNFWMIYFGVEDQSCSPR